MKLARPAAFALAACLLAATSPATAEYVPYHRLRSVHPAIDEAVAMLPDSGLHGALGRLSAQFANGQVRDLPPGSTASLPSGFDHVVAGALAQARGRVEAGADHLDAFGSLVVVQVLRAVAYTRLLELHADVDWAACRVDPTCDGPRALHELDALTAVLLPMANLAIDAIWSWAESEFGALPPAPPPLADDADPATFAEWLDSTLDALAIVPGVPHIEY